MTRHNQQLVTKLKKLREYKTIPAAQLEKPAYFADMLKQLLDRKLIQKYSPRIGQWAYRLLDETALDQLIAKYEEKQVDTAAAMDKVEAAKATGDAHNATESKYPSIPIRSVTPGCMVKNQAGEVIDLFTICRTGAALYLPINSQLYGWHLDGSICLVENQRYFWEAESVFQADYYLYTQGNFSNKVVDWLCASDLKKNPCFYFGDYDPHGIKIYLRLKKRLPHCRFYVPANLEELLEKYGNKHDLTKQHQSFDALLATDDPDIQHLRLAFEKTGKTLHQETLLIN